MENAAPCQESNVNSPSKKPSPSSQNQCRDYLTSIPPEILAKVISELPLSNYLDIAHTSRQLRSILKIHAAMICNARIRSKYQFAAEFLKTETMSEMFAFKCPGDHNHDQNKHFSLLGQLPVFPDKVHYDYEGNIFASGSHNLIDNERENSDTADSGKFEAPSGLERNCNCAAHSADAFVELCQSSGDYYQSFRGCFLNSFNNQHILVKDGELCTDSWTATFPRELIWYYGVDNLVITENTQQEADIFESAGVVGRPLVKSV
ncbi:hypothetical protein V8E51_002560 [Hyaloscypha variabilis]